MNLQNKINQLLSTQRKTWQLLDDNCHHLSNADIKELAWKDGTKVVLQHNSWSYHASITDVETDGSQMQPCVLCEEKRADIQKGIPFLNRYIILCNPYPALQNHLIIPLHSHVPQLIGKKIKDMLSLAELLPNYIVLYNGAQCGAITPYHFHFEAGFKTDVILSSENTLRSCFRIEAITNENAEEEFYYVLEYLKSHQPEEDEPLMNIISFIENKQYIIHIFPRKRYHPWLYTTKDDSEVLVTPNAIDMAGMFITPQKEDFDRITNSDIEAIYSQISMDII